MFGVRVDQFNSIAEWIRDVNAVIDSAVAGIHLNTLMQKTINECVQVAYQKRGMSFAGAVKVRIDAKMNFHRIVLEPDAATPGQIGRLGFFDKVEQMSVKSACGIFSPGWDRELNVVNSRYLHRSTVGWFKFTKTSSDYRREPFRIYHPFDRQSL